jgi:hypothetical protein
MNLVLTYCWREWRAQRAVLLAYTGMGLAALCLGFLLAPEHWWLDDGRRGLALSWFVAIGGIGVLAFAAPALTRSEFGAKDDQFVRRLPGALLPSFGGKLLFLTLVALSLPLVCLLVGEGYLLAIGQPWHDLFMWEYTGEVCFRWPWPAVMLGYAALLTPWVWALGTWLPGGRMAVGGVGLLVLTIGIGVVALLRQHPRIEHGLQWEPWLWLVPVLGLATAATSWVNGRRGGSAWRSARFGALALALGMLPPGVWFAGRAWDYRWPDLQRLASLDVRGLSPDGRFALATGASNREFAHVPMRIDLRDGSAEQIGSIHHYAHANVLPDGRGIATHGAQRYWRLDRVDVVNDHPAAHQLLDLANGTRLPLAWDTERRAVVLPLDLAGAVAAEGRANAPLRAPGGVRVWLEGEDLVFGASDSQVERVPFPGGARSFVRAAGHGLRVFRDSKAEVFDLTRRRPVSARDWSWGWFVRGRGVYQRTVNRVKGYWLHDLDDSERALDELRGCEVHGLVDDDHLLCSSTSKRVGARLFLLRVADLAIVDLPLPAAVTPGARFGVLAPGHLAAALLPRDPSGRIWLIVHGVARDLCLCLDPASRAFTEAPWHAGWELLAWPDTQSMLVRNEATIQRIDLTTGARTQLFPRRP